MKIEIKTPTTPNFIIVNGMPYAVGDFCDEELQEIGKRWTAALIEKAHAKRKAGDEIMGALEKGGFKRVV